MGTLPTILLTLPPSKVAGVAHLCVPQNKTLGVCKRFVPDIPVCSPHGREDLVNGTITLNAEEGGKVQKRILLILTPDVAPVCATFSETESRQYAVSSGNSMFD